MHMSTDDPQYETNVKEMIAIAFEDVSYHYINPFRLSKCRKMSMATHPGFTVN